MCVCVYVNHRAAFGVRNQAFFDILVKVALFSWAKCFTAKMWSILYYCEIKLCGQSWSARLLVYILGETKGQELKPNTGIVSSQTMA